MPNAIADPRTTPTHTFTRQAIVAEQGRRKNNKARLRNGEKAARAKSWVLPALGKSDLEAVLAGHVVEVNFHSGRTEYVALSD